MTTDDKFEAKTGCTSYEPYSRNIHHEATSLLPPDSVCIHRPTFYHLPTARAEKLDNHGDATHVTTTDTLNSNGPYNKIWEPYLAT